jgi:hypothetical protein
LGANFLWRTTLLALGASALAAWNVGVCLMPARSLKQVIMIGDVIMTITYSFVVIVISHSFLVAIVNYLPALVFLTGAFAVFYIRLRKQELLYGIAGLLLMFVAARIQSGGAGLNLAYFNHNAIYHVVQGVALALFFKSALWYVDREHEEQSAIEETIIPLVQIAR